MYANASFVGYNYDVKFKAIFNAYSEKENLDDAEDDVLEMHDKTLMNNDFGDCDKTKVGKQQKLDRDCKITEYNHLPATV